MFKNKTILLTGGTGSFGSNFLNYILKYHKNSKKIIIFSRDELKQYDLRNSINDKLIHKVRFFIGDVRDKVRVQRAMQDVDFVVHAAALKQVPAAEYDPFEYINTNINGAQNIIEASLDSNVQKVIALSTDKAASPVNLYGATKLCSDKLFSAANNVKGKRKISFSVVRYGNVFGSRGSVVPFFLKLKKNNDIPQITHKEMTRFNITLKQSIKMVEWCLEKMMGGEIFVPKIPSFRVVDLAEAIFNHKKIKLVGLRPGEKIHEEMITSSDSHLTYDIGNYYVILNGSNKKLIQYYKKFKKFKDLSSYNSKNNLNFLKIEELKKMIKKYEANEFF